MRFTRNGLFAEAGFSARASICVTACDNPYWLTGGY
jgi:hypothetical protein